MVSDQYSVTGIQGSVSPVFNGTKLQNSHVFPALIRKFHEAKVNKSAYVSVWGSGMPKREFLFAICTPVFS